jgi:hypothetical protein
MPVFNIKQHDQIKEEILFIPVTLTFVMGED